MTTTWLTTLAQWLGLLTLSLLWLHLRLRRGRSWRSVGPEVGALLRAAGLAGPAPAEASPDDPLRRTARVLARYAVALGRLPPVRRTRDDLDFMALGGHAKALHDGTPRSLVALVFAELHDRGAGWLLEGPSACWPVLLADLPDPDVLVVEQDDPAEQAPPPVGQGLHLRIRLGGHVLEGWTEVREVHGDRLVLAMPPSLSHHDLRGAVRTPVVDGVGLRVPGHTGGVVRLVVYDVSAHGLKVKVRGTAAALEPGHVLPVDLELLGQVYASFPARVAYHDRTEGTAGLSVRTAEGRAALGGLEAVLAEGRLP